MRKLFACAASLVCANALAGYTHYFTWHTTPSEPALRACVTEMNRVLEARTNLLVSPDEEGAVPGSLKLAPLSMDFNGIGDDAHEPFVFPGHKGFNFCKTEAKPYDEVVIACLLVARDHFPPGALSISSDGEWADWAAGARLYTQVLGRPAQNPMSERWGSPGFVGEAIMLGLVALAAAVYFVIRLRRR